MDHRGLGCWWTVDDVGARLYGLEDHLDFVHVDVDNLGVADLKAISKSAKTGAFGVSDNEKVDQGIECNTMDLSKEAVRKTHVVDDALVVSLLDHVYI